MNRRQRRRLSSERIIEIIEEEWARTRSLDDVGTTESKIVYARLVAEGVDVPKRAMAQILEALWNEGFIEETPYQDKSGITITEPKWRADLMRKLTASERNRAPN